MTKAEIFQIIKDSIVEILPDIQPDAIQIEESLKDLGANSVDRMDIVIQAMETVGVKIPLLEFGRINNIQGLVDLLDEKKKLLE